MPLRIPRAAPPAPLAIARTAAAIGLAILFTGTQFVPAVAAGPPVDDSTGTATLASSVDLAVIVPITAPITDPTIVYPNGQAPTTPPSLIDATTLAAYTAPDGLLTERLDAVYDRTVTLAIDPLVIASIRALGSDAPPAARAWLQRLHEATNPSFEMSWADSNLTAPLQAGRRNPVRYTSLDFAIDPSRFGSATATPVPGSGESQDPPLPTSDELTAWDYSIPSVAWPQPDTATAADAKTLRADYAMTLLADSNVIRTSTANAGTTIGAQPVVVTDSALSQQLSAAAAAADDSDWAVSSGAALSTIDTAAASGSSSIAVAIGRDAMLSSDRLDETIDALAMDPAITLVGLDSIRTGGVPTAKITSKPQDATLIERVKQLLEKESEVAAFATVAKEPALITGERRVRLLEALSPEASTYPGGADALAAVYLQEVKTTLTSVAIEKGSNLLFLADQGTISVEVSNQLAQPVTVYVTMRALNPILAIGDSRMKITVEPHSVERAGFPVKSVSNGTVELSATIESTTGVPIGDPVLRKTSVRAGWEGPVTIIGGILVVLVFAGGIVRSVVKRRRALTTADPSAEGGDG